jgi:tRNA(Ile)-lysidine synthase
VDLRARFLRFVQRTKLVARGDRVLVAVSGGVDSMVLLHLFNTTAKELDITMVAAHFDHAMRPGSAQDAAWLAEVCAAWNVELIAVRTADVLHGEAAARAARYRFLADAMQRANASRIATGHHADDQVETVLFRLLRGTGLRGLAGIPVRRGPIIRPLLRFRKAELRQYAAKHGVPFREDETNATDVYARNRIRKMLIPVMQKVRPHSPTDILTLARHAARAERDWRTVIADVWQRATGRRETDVSELARGTLLEYDDDTRARVLRAELRRFGVVPDRKATAGLLNFVQHAESGSSVAIGRNVRVERAYDLLRITRATSSASEQVVRIAGCEDGAGDAVIGGQRWRVAWTTSPAEKNDVASFNCSALRFPLELRGWRAGDRVRLAYGTKKLKKLFAEARIPFNERAAVPILVDADGRVCWVVGVARSVDAPAGQDAPSLTVTVKKHVQIS